jgi:hypothetical protein
MRESRPPIAPPGWRVFSRDGREIGTVDAVFADYLLARTWGLLPVDLYIPVSAVVASGAGRVIVEAGAEEAYTLWHRPLKRVRHD